MTTTTTISVTKRDGSTKSVESPYSDKDAMMRLYDLTGYELTGPHGSELVWHQPQLTSDFARSLVTQNEMRGKDLSAKQMAWVHIIVCEHDQRAAQAAEPQQQADAVVLPQVRAMIDEAGKSLQFPKVNLTTEAGQKVRLSRAGSRSRTPGVINITDGLPFGENTFFGRIALDGTLLPSRAMIEDVLALLQALDADSEAVVRAYGKKTGSCCFCARTLTDGRSVAMGYGPTCADNYGLPWGDERAASTVTIEAQK